MSEQCDFLNKVYDFIERDWKDDAIDVIFQHMNYLLFAGEFDACDWILVEVDISRISPVLMVSFLTITAAAKTKLDNRDRFFRAVKRAVTADRGEEATERLLKGLE